MRVGGGKAMSRQKGRKEKERELNKGRKGKPGQGMREGAEWE